MRRIFEVLILLLLFLPLIFNSAGFAVHGYDTHPVQA